MILLGHIGITAAAAHAADRDLDLRWPIVLSIGPDLIDKPMAALFPAVVNANSRGFAHTLLGALVVFALLLAFFRRPKRALLLWCCYLGHMLLDRMWLDENPIIFFWPLLGDIPVSKFGGEIVGPHLLTAYNLTGEAIGMCIILYMVRRYRLYERTRFKSFLQTGFLAV
jgi:membrane-bound metal-dependent hydrolase YbcI (DUF457 family)